MADETKNQGYAGDVTPAEAWERLKAEAAAQLVDVRTGAEWNFVGVPDLSSLGRKLHCVQWQLFPSMARNEDFVAEARTALGGNTGTPVYFLCRSGGRSRAAAMAMSEAGYTRCFNIVGGFEGDLDPERRRGKTNGWKAAGLPWNQT